MKELEGWEEWRSWEEWKGQDGEKRDRTYIDVKNPGV
jgi:acyl-CoA-binding protein